DYDLQLLKEHGATRKFRLGGRLGAILHNLFIICSLPFHYLFITFSLSLVASSHHGKRFAGPSEGYRPYLTPPVSYFLAIKP
ncbi:hypothetical protein, partial [Klebsiella oxytoca]|uniref:hypothetical protein n=1 Tax=Klebsiella oxytoca TaxID=571 RepID=UPI001CCE09C3